MRRTSMFTSITYSDQKQKHCITVRAVNVQEMSSGYVLWLLLNLFLHFKSVNEAVRMFVSPSMPSWPKNL